MVKSHTIGSGGGAIAWLDAGGNLRVGPRSAGARPGPACYGAGGTEPTVTDADLVLGIINPDNFLGGTQEARPRPGRDGDPRTTIGEPARPRPSRTRPRRSTRSRTPRPPTWCATSSSTPATTRATSSSTPSAVRARCTAPTTPRDLGVKADRRAARPDRRHLLGLRARRLRRRAHRRAVGPDELPGPGRVDAARPSTASRPTCVAHGIAEQGCRFADRRAQPRGRRPLHACSSPRWRPRCPRADRPTTAVAGVARHLRRPLRRGSTARGPASAPPGSS